MLLAGSVAGSDPSALPLLHVTGDLGGVSPGTHLWVRVQHFPVGISIRSRDKLFRS